MRGRSIVWVVCLILLGAIGVLWGINNAGPKPDEIKADLAAKIDALNTIPAEEAIRKDALAEEYLANEEYKQYAKAHWLKLERAHRSLHDAAQLERAAMKEVPPFLARSKDLSKIERVDLQNLIGELRTLIANYGATRFGDPLRKRQEELNAKLESLPKPVTPTDVMELSKKVLFAQNEGRFSDAMDVIDEFLKRPNANDHRKLIDTMIETTKSKATAAAAALVKKAQDLLDRQDKTAALQVLERSKSDFRRFTSETGWIDAQRRKITLR